MPVQFLSDSDYERLHRFPETVSPADLNRFFWLSQDDHDAIEKLRGEPNRLGFAKWVVLFTLPRILPRSPGGTSPPSGKLRGCAITRDSGAAKSLW